MKNELPNVVIVMARCCKSKGDFGIRFEEKGQGKWVADWAFAIKESSAEKEDYDKTNINGSFTFDDNYPGCAHCYTFPILSCFCGRVSCWDGETRKFTCPWCGGKGEIGGQLESLNAGIDR